MLIIHAVIILITISRKIKLIAKFKIKEINNNNNNNMYKNAIMK